MKIQVKDSKEYLWKIIGLQEFKSTLRTWTEKNIWSFCCQAVLWIFLVVKSSIALHCGPTTYKSSGRDPGTLLSTLFEELGFPSHWPTCLVLHLSGLWLTTHPLSHCTVWDKLVQSTEPGMTFLPIVHCPSDWPWLILFCLPKTVLFGFSGFLFFLLAF